MRTGKIVIFLVLSCGFFSCRRVNNAPDRYYNERPEESELEGVWEAKVKSLSELKTHGFTKCDITDHKLELNPDGTCFFKSYLTYQAPDIDGQELVEAKGVWHIGTDKSLVHGKGSQSTVQLDFKESAVSNFTISFNLATDGHKFILWSYIGDPDNNDYFDFEMTRQLR